MPNLIFVVSAPRSGSTFLVAALNSHPQIGMTNEAGWVPFLRKASLLASTPALETIDDGEGFVTQGILPYKYLDDFRKAFDGLVEDFVARFYEAADGPRHTYHGDKIQSHNDLDFMTRQFPKAKFIELVRDPLDVVVSSFAFDQKQPTPWQAASFEQRCSHLDRLYRANHELLRDRDQVTIRYEDLVTKPEPTLSRVFSFLDLSVDEEVTNYLEGPARELFSSHGTTASPQASIGRWRDAMTEAEIELAESMLGEHRRRFARTP